MFMNNMNEHKLFQVDVLSVGDGLACTYTPLILYLGVY